MGEFIIPISVRDETDLYSEFDPSGLSFSSELRDYLEDYVEDRKLGEKVCVEIQSNVKLNTERFSKALMLFVEKLSRRTHREIVRRNLNAVRLLLIGVLFIIIGILSGNHMPAIASAIISTIGSFAVWEASAIWIETLPVLRKRERVLNMLAGSGFRFTGSEGK